MPTDPREDQYQVDQYQVDHDSRFDNNPEFDQYRNSTPYGDPTVITTDSRAPNQIHGYQEAASPMELAGVEPDEEDLLAQEDRLDLQSDAATADSGAIQKRSIAKAGPSRTALVAGTLGVVALTLIGIMGIFGGGGGSDRQVAEDSGDDLEQDDELFSETDAYRSQLALVDQEREQALRQEQAEVEPSAPLEPETEPEDPETPETVRTSSPPPAPQRSAPAPRGSQSSAPAPARAPAPEPEPDPFAQWNTLAQAGTQGESFALVDPVEGQGAPPSQETTTSTAGPARSESERSTTAERAEQAGFPVAAIGGADIGSGEPSNNGGTGNNSRPPATASPQGQGTPLARSSGAQGILNRRPIEQSQGNGQGGEALAVPIGTTASAKLSVPIVASQSGDTLGRFAVALTEPLMAANGNVALPEGTVLITDVIDIDNNSLAIQQTVVAVIYKDASGQVQQEPITPDTLIIRGNSGGALIARRQGGRTGVDGGDILRVGIAAGLAQIGSSLNADDLFQTTSGAAGQDAATTSTTVVRQGRTNVLGAALEGFFGASSDLLLAEAEASLGEDETEPVLVVEDAENLQVFVNGFLTVRR